MILMIVTTRYIIKTSIYCFFVNSNNNKNHNLKPPQCYSHENT